MTGYGRAALDELRDVVRHAKDGDPLTPVTVLVPTNIAGIVARRFLAHGLGDGHHGVAALYPTTITRLAEQLAAPVLHHRRPATGPVVAAAWRAELVKDPGVFAAVVDHPATVQALVMAGRELADLDDTALDALAGIDPLGPDLIRLHRAVQSDLAADWYDTTDLLRTATEVCRQHPERTREAGAVVLYLPQALSQAEAALVAALAGTQTLTAVTGLTGHRQADAAVHRSLARIGTSAPPAPQPPTATRVLTASDADDEVRCVVRQVVDTLKTTKPDRVAVLYTAQSPYARLLHEHLGAAGITVNGPGTRPVHERAVSRAVLELFDLAGTGPERDVPRGDLFRVLATAPMTTPAGDRIPVARWERLSRSAGVVHGTDWDTRLTRFADDERQRLADEQTRPDPRPGIIDRLTASIEGADALRAFSTGLRGRLQHGSSLTSWSALSDWGLRLVHDLIGEPDTLTTLPSDEQYAAVAVEQALRGVAVLDSLGAPASLTNLRDTVATQLENALPRVGRFGDGVLVGPISHAIGLDADVVVVLGLAEALFPGRLREDPLLPERARAASHNQLVSYRERIDTSHRQLLAAFAAAPTVLASFPRGDLRTKGQHLPSRWLLPTLRALSGRPDLTATEWDAPPTQWMTTSASYAGSLTTTGTPASEQEWRTQTAHAGVPHDDPVVSAAHEMTSARASGRLTRFDGDLTAVAAGLPDYAAGLTAVSPTSLEGFAGCPHAYFAQRLLRVVPVEAPEDVITISAADVGTLMHEAFDALVIESRGRLPGYGQSWTRAQRDRLAEIATETADRFAAQGRTGHPRLWRQTLARVLADLQAMLVADDAWRAEHRAAVVASELAFGMRGAPPVAIALPDGGTLLMQGAADKVDRAENGTLYVTDIKSGSRRAFEALSEANPVAGGTKLQLPVYAHAARAAHGPGADVEAAYWFVRRDKGRIELPLTEDVERTYAETLQTIVTSIRAGLFPARPPIDPDYAWVQCAYCNPDGIGHAEARRRWEQTKTDPRLGELVALIEPLPDDDAPDVDAPDVDAPDDGGTA